MTTNHKTHAAEGCLPVSADFQLYGALLVRIGRDHFYKIAAQSGGSFVGFADYLIGKGYDVRGKTINELWDFIHELEDEVLRELVVCQRENIGYSSPFVKRDH